MPVKGRPFRLHHAVVKRIEASVDKLFDRAKVRVLGPWSLDKRIVISGAEDTKTLPSLYITAASQHGSLEPDKGVLRALLSIPEGYIEAQRAATKAKVVQAVSSFLTEAHAKGIDTDVTTVLGGQLSEIWGKVTGDMHRIIDTEAQNVRNGGALDAIMRVNADAQIEDPVVFFVVVRDEHLCDECKRLHLLEDGVTPRCWYLSELGQGYHKRGQNFPALGGLHPHCRCTLVTLMPGYGFTETGMVHYVGPDHKEIEKQRELGKSELMKAHRAQSPIPPVGEKTYEYKGYTSSRPWVHIDRVIPTEDQQNPRRVKKILDQIEQSRRFDPLFVWGRNGDVESLLSDPNEKFDVEDGHHRLRVARSLGLDRVPIEVGKSEHLEKGAMAKAGRFPKGYVPTAKDLRPFCADAECYDVAQSVSSTFPSLKYDAGFYIRPNGEAADHAWLRSPDGGIVDTTHGQFDSRKKILIAPPGTAWHKRYRSFDEHHPPENPDHCLLREIGRNEPCQVCSYRGTKLNKAFTPDRFENHNWFVPANSEDAQEIGGFVMKVTKHPGVDAKGRQLYKIHVHDGRKFLTHETPALLEERTKNLEPQWEMRGDRIVVTGPPKINIELAG